MRPSPYAGPRPPPPKAFATSKVQTDLPVTASMANSFDPEWTYMTPSMTRGVALLIGSRAGVWNDHFSERLPTFETSISLS